MIDVSGRGMKQGRITFKVDGDDFVIRVDDDGRPEFWCEIRLGAEELDRFRKLASGETMIAVEEEACSTPEALWEQYQQFKRRMEGGKHP